MQKTRCLSYILPVPPANRKVWCTRLADTWSGPIIHFCTADIGWITGHSYILYGPLSAGATSVMFEGIPTYPDPGRFWDIVDKYGVNILYTAPTAIRSLMHYGLDPLKHKDLSSLKT